MEESKLYFDSPAEAFEEKLKQAMELIYTQNDSE